MASRFILTSYLSKFPLRPIPSFFSIHQRSPHIHLSLLQQHDFSQPPFSVQPLRRTHKLKLAKTVERMEIPATDEALHNLEENVDVLPSNSLKIFDEILKHADPSYCVAKQLQVRADGKGNELLIINGQYTFRLNNNIYVAAFGKSVLSGCLALKKRLGEHIQQGVISIPDGLLERIKKEDRDFLLNDEIFNVYEGAKNNLPDDNSGRAAVKIYEMIQNLEEDDILLVFISGGGSALLTLPPQGIDIDDIKHMTQVVASKGATIKQLNTVRKTVSLLKGGRMVRTAYPAKVIGLIISDVIDSGKNGSEVASGPTVVEHVNPTLCVGLLKTLNAWNDIRPNIRHFIRRETLKYETTSEGATEHEEYVAQLKRDNRYPLNMVLIDNEKALKASVNYVENQLKISSFLFNTRLQGEAREVGKGFARLAAFVCSLLANESRMMTDDMSLAKLEMQIIGCGLMNKDEFTKFVERVRQYRRTVNDKFYNLALIAGGETTTTLCQKPGYGGRNQELVVAAGIELNELFHEKSILRRDFDVNVTSLGTDGQDGPTANAGGFISYNIMELIQEHIIGDTMVDNRRDCEKIANGYLAKNDTGSLLDLLKRSVKIGLTGTNIMDVTMLLISSKR
ncbi:hypothetical protein SNEBB_009835 [Seison nebaliae]|nr:hypothetical protein SNEBB_009835 [Seison nebaliae]